MKNKNSKRGLPSGTSLLIKKVFMITMALACVSAMVTIAGNILSARGVLLPKWVVWESGTYNVNPFPYQIELNRKSVSIFLGNDIVWTSPKDIKVQQVLSCDIDRDEEDELVLLCWKKGRFGAYKPFWVEKDEALWSQHIFVYEFEEGKIAPKWMSSYLGQEVVRMDTRETVKTFGKKESGENNASYGRLFLTDTQGLITGWIWGFWGFQKEDTDISFAMFGDNLIHESIYTYGLHHDGSFSFLFENVKELIAGSDISVINQETPFTDNPALYSGYPRFGTPLNVGQAIADAGFDVVTCATNHALDQGVHGIIVTKEFFDSHNILCLGIETPSAHSRDFQNTHPSKDASMPDGNAHKPYGVIEKKGVRFALFNYTYGTNGIKIPEENPYMVHLLEDEEEIRRDIQKAKSETDFVVVFVHWGTENSQQTDEFQQKWTQVFLDSKVDVVVGTHPHSLQPFEMLTDEKGHEMLVYYSIGNFVSAQPEKSCVKGGVACFTVSPASNGYKITDYTLLPLAIIREDDGRYTVRQQEDSKHELKMWGS